MDLHDTTTATEPAVRFLIRDRDGKYPPGFDTVLADSGITVDRTLIWNQRHLLQALREYEDFYNTHRPHQGFGNAGPLAPLPEPITEPDRLARLHIHRHDRLGGVLHEYQHAA